VWIHRRPALVLLTLLLIATGCSTAATKTPSPSTSGPSAGTVTTTDAPLSSASARPRPGTYTNPVFDHDAPDPGVLRAPDGTFYAYTTQSIYLDMVEIPILASTDLVHWRQVGDALPHPPDWVVGGPGGDVWAPHPLYWHGRYLLFYAGRQAADGSMAIGLATATSPRGPFLDLGHPLLTRRTGQPDYTAIDPFVLADKGKLWIYWGSDHEPIRVARLNGSATNVIGTETDLVMPVADDGSYGGLVEGAWVLPHAGWFYLFYSVGDCCSEDANYSVFVARSREPNGPFKPGPGNPILHQDSHFWAVGHNATAVDDAGDDWLLYHARSRESVSDDRLLMLDRIEWRNGWPSVNDDHGASWTPRPMPKITRK